MDDDSVKREAAEDAVAPPSVFAEEPVSEAAPQTAEALEARLELTRKRIRLAAYAIAYHNLNRTDGDPTPYEQRVVNEIADKLAPEDVDRAAYAADFIVKQRKTAHGPCYGRGVVIVDKVFQLCSCVKLPPAAHAEEEEATPKTVSTRATGRSTAQGRLTWAREVLARAEAAQRDACAELDAQIKEVRALLGVYFAERTRLAADIEQTREDIDGAIAEARARAEEFEQLADTAWQHAAKHRTVLDGVGTDLCGALAVVLPIHAGDAQRIHDAGQTLAALVRALIAAAQEIEGALSRGRPAAMSAADHLSSVQALRETLARREVEHAATVAKLDEQNAASLARLASLEKEHARVSRHHQPKIDAALARVRRLVFLCGDGDGTAASVPSEEVMT